MPKQPEKKTPPGKFERPKRLEFLGYLAEGLGIMASLNKAGVSEHTYYTHLKAHPTFRSAMARAQDRASPERFSKYKQEQFLREVREGNTISGAAQKIGVPQWKIHYFRSRHPRYNKAVELALKGHLMTGIDFMQILGLNGNHNALNLYLCNISRRLHQQGMIEDHERWLNISRHEISGPDGRAIESKTIEDIDLSKLSDEELEQYGKLLKKASTSKEPDS